MLSPDRRETRRPIPLSEDIGTQRIRRIQVAAVYLGFVFALVGNAIANHAASGVSRIEGAVIGIVGFACALYGCLRFSGGRR